MNCPSAQQATLDGYRTEQRTEQELSWAYRAAGLGKGSVVLAMSGGYPLPQARDRRAAGRHRGGDEEYCMVSVAADIMVLCGTLKFYRNHVGIVLFPVKLLFGF